MREVGEPETEGDKQSGGGAFIGRVGGREERKRERERDFVKTKFREKMV